MNSQDYSKIKWNRTSDCTSTPIPFSPVHLDNQSWVIDRLRHQIGIQDVSVNTQVAVHKTEILNFVVELPPESAEAALPLNLGM